MPAADALASAYHGNRAAAAHAIKVNGGNPEAPAAAFSGMWENKFNGIKSTSLPSFATGFGSGQPYYGGAPGPGVMPPLPSSAPLPDPTSPAPSLMEQASASPAAPQPLPGVTTLPAAPSMGQVPPLPVAGQDSQALPPPVAYNADDPSSPLPDRGLALAHARAMANGDPIQARMNVAEVNRRYEEQNRETYTERMELQQQLPDLNAAASAGVDGVNLPERDIRRLFPPAKAQAIIGEFHANQAVGGLMRGVQWASPDQLGEMQRDISSGPGRLFRCAALAPRPRHDGRRHDGCGARTVHDLGYFRRRETAARQVNAEIQRRTGLLVGPEADPAAYVAHEPSGATGLAQGTRDPRATSDTRQSSLGMQSFLGVPEAQQHLLTRGRAQDLANQIASCAGPQGGPAATGHGRLRLGVAQGVRRRHGARASCPPATRPCRCSTTRTTPRCCRARWRARSPAPTASRARSIDDTVDLMGGAKGEAAKVRDAVRFDPEVKNYVQSIQKSGASADQVSGIVNSVETLALAKRGAGEASDAASSASAAVKSFFGRFDYMPNGGARVPSKSFDAVTANAQATIDGLALDHIAVPQRFGQPGQPEAAEYLDTIKAAPTWVTSPKSDAIWLMDYGGRVVRGRDGQPVAVPFNLPGAPPAMRAPPLAGVTTIPAAPQAGAPVSPAAAAAARAAADPSANVVPGL